MDRFIADFLYLLPKIRWYLCMCEFELDGWNTRISYGTFCGQINREKEYTSDETIDSYPNHTSDPLVCGLSLLFDPWR